MPITYGTDRLVYGGVPVSYEPRRWSDVLPPHPLLGLVEQLPQARLRSSLTGTPRQRRRFSAGERPVELDVRLTTAQKVEFERWYSLVLKDGVMPFLWEDPVTDQEVRVRFGDRRPEFRLDLGGDEGRPIWAGHLTLEVLP